MSHLPTVTKEELLKIPYIANSPRDDRIGFLNPFFNANLGRFQLPISPDGKITYLEAEPIQACYYSENKLSDSDLSLRLIDYTARYFSFGKALYTLFGIIRDIFNCGVVVEKYFLYLDIFRKDKDISIGNFVSADLEFLFSNIRSAYDSLQCLISVVWDKEKKIQIPRRFSTMMKCHERTMVRKYHLPKSLIACYQQSKDFFEKCKTIRDDIHHSNVDVPTIFCLEDGFALDHDRFLSDPIAKSFDIWPSEKTKKNGLVSVLALYAYLNKSFLNDTEGFSESLRESCPKIPIISADYTLFLRGPYLKRLADSDKYLREQWKTS